jgi:ADP-ribose pyrophosphatase YjhB (NUDIX family)
LPAGREYPEGPIPGTGAVVFRGKGNGAEVLLVRRAREPLAGSWSLPGGAIEVGETAAEACAREVLEETGLSVEVLEPVETVDIILRDEAGRVRFQYLIVDMLCRLRGGELHASDDVSDAAWASVDDVLARGAFSLTPRACKVIGKAFVRFEEMA